MFIDTKRAAMLAPMLHSALDDLHGNLQVSAAHALRILADDLEQAATEENNPLAAAVAECEKQQAIAGARRDAHGAEFWRRLAGSCRKAAGMI